MDVRKMKKDDLELMSNKDITFNLLENSKKTINTADLFNEILKLLELLELLPIIILFITTSIFEL